MPCISRGVFVMTLTTPVMALAPHTADAGPRITSICLISVGVDRQEIPRHEPEEVLIDRPPVQEDQQGIGKRAGGGAARDVDVARRRLHRVQPGHEPQQIRHALGRERPDHLFAQHAHRGGRIEELFFASRCRDDDDVTNGPLVFRRPAAAPAAGPGPGRRLPAPPPAATPGAAGSVSTSVSPSRTAQDTCNKAHAAGGYRLAVSRS